VRSIVWLLAIAVGAVSVWYLTAPPRDEGAYRERAARAVQTLDAQVRTATLWSDALREGKTLSTSARVGLEDNARQAEKATARFEGYEPPRGTDRLRARFTDLASRVTDELSAVEISARRGEWEEVEAARPRLRRLALELGRFRRELGG
jgi:hypothetical protein